jgi:hypothetical protein
MGGRLTERRTPAAGGDPAAPARLAPARRSAPNWLFGVLGFALGAAFWHAVGFWDFVGRVVFRSSGDELRHVRDAEPPRLRGRVAGETVVLTTLSADACTSLSLDRGSGHVRAGACAEETLPLRVSRTGHREDSSIIMPVRRNNVREAWATTVVEPVESD